MLPPLRKNPAFQVGAANAVASPSPTPSPSLYVANRSANTITEYRATATGNATPSARITGSNTTLNAPSSLGLDSSRRLYVLNVSSIAVYRAGSRGNAPPEFLTAGGLTQLTSPQGLAVDTTGKVYVTNQGGSGGYLTAYAPGSNGDRSPVQTIYDGSSLLFVPSGVAVHGSLLYVADQGDQTINEYSVSANGIVNPVNVISGLGSPIGIAVDSLGRIYVTDGNSVIVYAANATGNATPLRRITGSATRLNGPAGLTVMGGLIFVANGGSNAITVYSASGNGDIKPLRIVSGPNTGLNDPVSAGVR